MIFFEKELFHVKGVRTKRDNQSLKTHARRGAVAGPLSFRTWFVASPPPSRPNRNNPNPDFRKGILCKSRRLSIPFWWSS